MKSVLLLVVLTIISMSSVGAKGRLPRGIKLIEGDIAVYSDLNGNAVESAPDLSARKWKDGVVPYLFDYRDRNNSSMKNAVINAIKVLTEKTNLRFVKKTNERDFVTFTSSSNGCWSFVGRQGGSQFINLDRGCHYTYIVAHEIMHAVGVQHEQSRPDRDDHINVNLGNATRRSRGNFNIAYRAIHGDYDYDSIMHYGSYDFSKNGYPILTKKDGSTIKANRRYLSRGDIQGINFIYPNDYAVAPISSEDLRLKVETSSGGPDNRYVYKVSLDLESNIIKQVSKVQYIFKNSSFKPHNVYKRPHFQHVFYSHRKSYQLVVHVSFKNGITISKLFNVDVDPSIVTGPSTNYSNFDWKKIKLKAEVKKYGSMGDKISFYLNNKPNALGLIKSVKYVVEGAGIKSSLLTNKGNRFLFVIDAINYTGRVKVEVTLKNGLRRNLYFKVNLRKDIINQQLKKFRVQYYTKKKFFSNKVKYYVSLDLSNNLLSEISYVEYRVSNSNLRPFRSFNHYQNFSYIISSYSYNVRLKAKIVLKSGKFFEKDFNLTHR